MDENSPDLLRAWPRPLAWSLSSVKSSRDRTARLVHLLELAEESVRYLALLSLARYIELRDEHAAKDVDAAVGRLRRPSFGDWVLCLEKVHKHLMKVDGPPLGVSIEEPWDAPGMVALASKITGTQRKRITGLQLARDVVALRNRTKGHGQLDDSVAREMNEPLEEGWLELLTRIRALVSRPPVYIQAISYHGPEQFEIEYVPLVGTGRPMPATREVTNPGVLRRELVYAWDDKGGAPLNLVPLMHYGPDLGGLFLLAGIDAGAPVYTSCEKPEARHRPDKLMAAFEQRAQFMVVAQEPVATATRPAAAVDAYAKAVQQAMVDGVVTTDEWDLLRVMRTALGLSEEEAEFVHAEAGMPARPMCSPSAIPAPAAAADSSQLVVPLSNPKASPAPEAAPSRPPVSVRSADPRKRAIDKARQLDLADDIDGAIAVYRELLDANPADAEVRASMAGLLTQLSAHAEVERLCREGLDLLPHALVHARLADSLMLEGRIDEAFEQAEAAVKLDPNCASAYQVLSDCWQFAGDHEKRASAMRKALELAPDDPIVKASALLLPDVPGEEAITRFQDVLRAAPRDRVVRLNYVDALSSAELSAEVTREAEALIRRNGRWHPLLGIAGVHLALTGRAAEARDLADKALALCPTSLFGLFAMSLALTLSGQQNEACEVDKRLKDLYPRYPLAIEWHARRLSQREPEEGIAELRRGLLIAPRSRDLRLSLAEALEDKGDYEAALTQARGVLEDHASWSKARNRVASILINMARFDEAAAVLDRATITPDVLLLRARIHISLDRHREAEPILREALRMDPSNTTAAIHLIVSLGVMGRAGAARKVLEECPLKPPSLSLALARAHLLSGSGQDAVGVIEGLGAAVDSDILTATGIALDSGNTEVFERLARRGVELLPDSTLAHYYLGVFFHNARILDQARVEYETALRIDPNHFLALNNLAMMFEFVGDPKTALEYLERAVATPEGKSNARVLLNAARLSIAIGKVDQALIHADAARKLGAVNEYYSEIPMALIEGGRTDAALEMVLAGIQELPGHTYLRRVHASIVLKLGDRQGAIRILKDALRLAPAEPWLHYDVASLLWGAGQKRQALLSYNEAHRLAPDDLDLALSFGECLLRLGDLARAETHFRKLLDSLPDRQRVLNMWLGTCYEMKRFEQALDIVRDLRQSSPDDIWLRGEEGLFLKELGRKGDALPLLQEGIGADPVFGRHLGECLEEEGRLDEALEVFRRTVAALPTLPNPRRALIKCLIRLGEVEWAKEELQEFLQLQPPPDDAEEVRRLVEGHVNDIN